MHLKYLLKDVFRNKKHIIMFNVQLIIFNIFLTICISEISDTFKFKDYVDTINDYDIVSFNKYYTNNRMKHNIKLDDFFMDTLQNNQRAYSSIVGSRIENYETYDTVVGLGTFGQIFKLYNQSFNKNDDCVVLIGSNVNELEIGDKITVGYICKKEVTVDGRMQKGKYYILSDTYYVDLDNSIVILPSYKFFQDSYSNFYYEQLITNYNLVCNRTDDIQNFVNLVAETESMYVEPLNKLEKINALYKNMLQYPFFFFLFFVLAASFTLISVIFNIITLVNNNMLEYCIHRIYGATILTLYLRILLYIITIFALPIFTFYGIDRLFRLSIGLNVLVLFAWGCIFISIFSIYPAVKIYKQDITYYLRRGL